MQSPFPPEGSAEPRNLTFGLCAYAGLLSLPSYAHGSIGPVIHPVTSRPRTPGRGIGSAASTRLASETCCCSLMGRTNRLVALSSRPVLHWRWDDSCSLSRLTLGRSRTTPIAETARRSRMLSRPLWRCRRLRAATRPASLARTARNPRLGAPPSSLKLTKVGATRCSGKVLRSTTTHCARS